ncbi:MAG TPA: ferrous iron transport protein A [Candidatus Corynebacterium faecipullorum]|nr:ferrous iron transport protein A [Candidatus Corynebacterium faecipullorum]
MAVRLAELGIRPGATLTMGPRVAGGARVVSVGSCRYAIDKATLQAIEV